MRRLDSFLGGLGVAVGITFALSQFGLYTGGISYRKDCLGRDGTVKSSWTFSWFAPIPYVFRPSDENCVIHTGTRVALNTVGIGGFPKPTTASLAKSLGEGRDPNLAYFGVLKATILDYETRSAKVQSIGGGIRLIESTLTKLNGLSPPDKYQNVHGRFVQLLTDLKRYGEAGQQALAESDHPAAKIVQRHIAAQDSKFLSILREFNRLHASD